MSDIDRIIATCRQDSRCVSGIERRMLCDEIERLRAENAVRVRELQDEIDWLRSLVPPQTLAAAVKALDEELKQESEVSDVH